MRHYTKGHPVLISQLERQCARNEIQLKADSSHFLCVLSISLFLFVCFVLILYLFVLLWFSCMSLWII